MQIREAGGGVPAAQLVDAGHPLGVLGLVDPVLQLLHEQRAAAGAERRAVGIAKLRQLGAVGARRRAAEDRAQEGDLVGRLELEPDAGGGERIDRAALQLIGGQDGGITEGGVDQVAGGRADQELVVGGELADAQRDLVVVEILLEPGGEQPGRRQRLDIARIRDAADVVGRRQAVGMADLVEGGVGGGAAPAEGLVQVEIERELEAVLVAHALAEAARQDGQRLAHIVEGDVEPVLAGIGAHPAPIAGELVAGPEVVCRRAHARSQIGRVGRRCKAGGQHGQDQRLRLGRQAAPSVVKRRYPCGSPRISNGTAT